jgi:hypothetical protein
MEHPNIVIPRSGPDPGRQEASPEEAGGLLEFLRDPDLLPPCAAGHSLSVRGPPLGAAPFLSGDPLELFPWRVFEISA